MCQGRHAQYRIAPVVWTRTEALLRVRTALPGRAGAATGVGGRIATPGDEPDTTTRPPHRNAGHRALRSNRPARLHRGCGWNVGHRGDVHPPSAMYCVMPWPQPTAATAPPGGRPDEDRSSRNAPHRPRSLPQMGARKLLGRNDVSPGPRRGGGIDPPAELAEHDRRHLV